MKNLEKEDWQKAETHWTCNNRCECGCHTSESSSEEMKREGCDICQMYEHKKEDWLKTSWQEEFHFWYNPLKSRKEITEFFTTHIEKEKENAYDEGKIAGSMYAQDYADKAYRQGFKEAKAWDNKMVLKGRESARQEFKEALQKDIESSKKDFENEPKTLLIKGAISALNGVLKLIKEK